tara:strand:- start:682 stop:1632 length:951 start_codon:yes stop_codon:yes gene_type:complete
MKPASLALLASTLVVISAHGQEAEVDPFGSYTDPTAEDIQLAVDEYRAVVDGLTSEEEWSIGWHQHVLLKKSLNARNRKPLKPIFEDEAAFYGAVRALPGRIGGAFAVPDLILTEALFTPGFFVDHPECLEPRDDQSNRRHGPGNSDMSFYLLSRFDIDKSTFDPAAVSRGFYDPEFTLKLGDQLRLLNPAVYDQLGFLKTDTDKEAREEIEKAIVALIRDYEYPTKQEVGRLIARQRKDSERRRIRREKRRDLEEGRRANGGLRSAGMPSGPGIEADAADDQQRWPLIGALAFLLLSIAWCIFRRLSSTFRPENP